jgi:probable F420-dependent oxidoreductase
VRVGIALIEGYSFSREPVNLGIAGIAAAARRIEALGFDGIISSETAGHDPFLPLLVAAEHTERIRLATGIAVAFPRSPMAVAQVAWDLQRFSGGRFCLGLGTQVKRHNERRYGVPWTGPPGPRMREYVGCLRAIFETFQNPEELRYFRGEHYQFTMLPPVFRPEPGEHPHIPIQIAAVNPFMCRLAGEMCDSVFAHPVCTARYMREVVLPAVADGARKAARPPSDIEIVGAPIVVTGRNEVELVAERRLLKRRVAFYASTRTYHPVFAVHGWQELGVKLHELSLENRWDEMVDLIPDEMAEEFATIGLLDEIGPKLKERWSRLLSTLNLPTDLPLATPEDERRVGDIVRILQHS